MAHVGRLSDAVTRALRDYLSDDVGEILVYECPECGYQEEIRVEPDEASLSDDDDVESLDPDEA